MARSRRKINQPGYRQGLAGLASDFFVAGSFVCLIILVTVDRGWLSYGRLWRHMHRSSTVCQRPKRDCMEWNIHIHTVRGIDSERCVLLRSASTNVLITLDDLSATKSDRQIAPTKTFVGSMSGRQIGVDCCSFICDLLHTNRHVGRLSTDTDFCRADISVRFSCRQIGQCDGAFKCHT